MNITGHRTRRVFDRYRIVSPSDLQSVAHQSLTQCRSKGNCKVRRRNTNGELA